jgi:ABC-type transport system substrate-binding protein
MRRSSLFVAALVLLGLVGCGKGRFNNPSSASKGNVFRYPIPNKPTTMDPGKVQDGDTIDVIQQVYEGLVGWDEKNQVSKRLADSWDVSKDGRTYTFHLKKGVKFSSGRDVTAADFKWCIERNCNPKLASETAAVYLTDIIGVNDAIAGKRADVSGLTVVDPYTLRVQIDKPRPYFLGKLTYPVAYVFDKNALPDPTKEMSQVSEMVGTGGFKFQTVNVDQIVTMVANDLYYEGRPKIDRIERPYVGDASTRLAMFKSGQVDLVPLEREDAASVQKDPAYKDQLHFFPRPAIFYVGINCNVVPALKDARVRRAMAMAVDRDNICKNVLGGMNDEADCILPPQVFGHRDKVKAVPYDPAGAAQLLSQAGYPGGRGIPELTMSFRNNRPDIRIVASAVGQDLEKNLGIKVTFKAVEWGSYLDQYDRKQIPFLHMRWSADYLDAQNFLSTLLATNGPENKINYHNPQFDALCAAADSSLDPNERLKLYGQAEDLVLQDAPFIPIYFEKDAELISPRVQGIRNSVFGHLPHTKVWLQDEKG